MTTSALPGNAAGGGGSGAFFDTDDALSLLFADATESTYLSPLADDSSTLSRSLSHSSPPSSPRRYHHLAPAHHHHHHHDDHLAHHHHHAQHDEPISAIAAAAAADAEPHAGMIRALLLRVKQLEDHIARFSLPPLPALDGATSKRARHASPRGAAPNNNNSDWLHKSAAPAATDDDDDDDGQDANNNNNEAHDAAGAPAAAAAAVADDDEAEWTATPAPKRKLKRSSGAAAAAAAAVAVSGVKLAPAAATSLHHSHMSSSGGVVALVPAPPLMAAPAMSLTTAIVTDDDGAPGDDLTATAYRNVFSNLRVHLPAGVCAPGTRVYIDSDVGYSGKAKRFKAMPDVGEAALIVCANLTLPDGTPLREQCLACYEYFTRLNLFKANREQCKKILLIKNNTLLHTDAANVVTLHAKALCASRHFDVPDFHLHVTVLDSNRNELARGSSPIRVRQWKKGSAPIAPCELHLASAGVSN